jgi:hypothetical protein
MKSQPSEVFSELPSLFADAASSLDVIRQSVRQKLLAPSEDQENSLRRQEDSVLRGTEDWNSFRCFGFDEEGIEISFAPYAVAAYASGPQFVKLPFAEFKALLKPWFRNALEI